VARNDPEPRPRGRRTRILFCENNTDGTVGGSYYSLLYLASGLDRTRFEPIVVFYHDHELVPRFREAGVDVRILRKPRGLDVAAAAGGRTGLGPVRRILRTVQRAANLVRLLIVPAIRHAFRLRSWGVDLVHLNNSILWNHEWMLAARLVGVPCMTHERGINRRYPSNSRRFGRRLAAIVCISEAVRERMVSLGVDYPNMVTIHNGLDPDAMRVRVDPSTLRARHGIAEGRPIVGIVGNVKAWKGQESVVRAVEIVRRDVPDVCCLVVGSLADEAYARRLRDLVGELAVEPNVTFTGFTTEVADYMNAMSVVLHASVLPEPFGRVLLEAMALRKPVVATRDGGVVEIVEDGATGLLVEPGDSEAMARAVVTLLSDEGMRRRLGERGRQRLEDRFGIDVHVRKVTALYDRILGSEGPEG